MSKNVFRASFWHLWSRLSLLGIALVILGTTLSQVAASSLGSTTSIFSSEHFSLMLITTIAVLLLTAFFVSLHVLFFPIIVDQDGITSRINRGRFALFPWSDIISVRTVRHAGTPCYRVDSRSGKMTIFVPLCIKQKDLFDQLLKQKEIAFSEKSPILPKLPKIVAKPVAPQPIREAGYIVVSTEQNRRR